jgi:hypothetical protein
MMRRFVNALRPGWIVCGLAVLGGGIAVGFSTSAPNPSEKIAISEASVRTLVMFAVLEGLYTDGVSDDDVDAILAIDPKTKQPRFDAHFVNCCPLCHPAFDAFALYRSRPGFSQQWKDGRWKNNYGTGLDANLSKQLHSEKQADQLAAIQQLVDTWVRRRLDSMRLTTVERGAWSNAIEDGRKQGMQGLTNLQRGGGNPDWKGCAICDGTAEACKKPR